MTTEVIDRPLTRAERLKQATQCLHKRVDISIVGQRPFADRDRYADFVEIQYRFMAAIEPLYRDAGFAELLPGLPPRSRMESAKREAGLGRVFFMSNFNVRLALGVALWIIAVPGFAFEPWEGRWSESPDPQTCTAQRGDGPPLVVMSRNVTPSGQRGTAKEGPKGDKGQITFEREADSFTCYIGKITGVRNLEAWIFDIECHGDGDIRRDRTIVMRTTVPKGIAAYNFGGESVGGFTQLYRCSTVNEGLAPAGRGEHDAADGLLMPVAEGGDALAQYKLGTAYTIGQGVEQDYRAAKMWFLRSAEQGNAAAQNSLGVMFEKGQGITADTDVALVWFMLAAFQHEPEAIKNRDALIQRMAPAEVAAAQRVAEMRRDGKAFSTVEGEVQFERGVGVWRNCTKAEVENLRPETNRAEAVTKALNECAHLGEALIGDLARIDQRLDLDVSRALISDVREMLRKQFVEN